MTYNGTGLTKQTTERIQLNAGTIHVGLEYKAGEWNFAESLLCATQGGNKLTYTENIEQIEVDNAFVAVEGLDVKYGENGTLECNPIEITDDILQKCIHLVKKETSGATGYELYETQGTLPKDAYIKNFAFVGETTSKKPIIIIFGLAIVTSGFELDAKPKQANPYKLTVEARASLENGEYKKLPIKIYYPIETEANS